MDRKQCTLLIYWWYISAASSQIIFSLWIVSCFLFFNLIGVLKTSYSCSCIGFIVVVWPRYLKGPERTVTLGLCVVFEVWGQNLMNYLFTNSLCIWFAYGKCVMPITCLILRLIHYLCVCPLFENIWFLMLLNVLEEVPFCLSGCEMRFNMGVSSSEYQNTTWLFYVSEKGLSNLL